jgi:Holliday junction DNA helicase RuvA
MRVTDETLKLYGFAGAEEREWFRLLQTVQNVGARVALSVLSTLSPADLSRALALGDKAMIGRAPGVGPKLALRIATELKDKVPAMMMGAERAAMPVAPRGPEGEAVSALVHLGYGESQAAEAVARAAAALGAEAATAVLIREALKGMAR